MLCLGGSNWENGIQNRADAESHDQAEESARGHGEMLLYDGRGADGTTVKLPTSNSQLPRLSSWWLGVGSWLSVRQNLKMAPTVPREKLKVPSSKLIPTTLFDSSAVTLRK